jgi:hypothetical protein
VRRWWRRRWHRRDHLHQTNESPISVAAGGCVVAAGPVDVNAAGTMFYEIDDAAPGTDAIEAVIISDSFYGSEGCAFSYDQTVVDESFPGTRYDSGPV